MTINYSCTIIQMCSGITRDRLLKGELHAQSFQKFIDLHLCTDCFMKTSPQSSEQMQWNICIDVLPWSGGHGFETRQFKLGVRIVGYFCLSRTSTKYYKLEALVLRERRPPWPRQIITQITTKIYSVLHCTTQDPSIKFHSNLFITFWVMLSTDKQTNR